ncbi:coatomer subunit alpha-1 [Tanacetum coccineum]
MATRGRKKAIAEPAPPARDPRDVETIERLQQRIQELEFQQLQQDSPAEETETDSNVWDDGDEEEEYPFVNEYPSFQDEPIMLMEEESCPAYDTNNEEEESMPVYDTDIKDVIEEEEDGDKDEVVYADHINQNELNGSVDNGNYSLGYKLDTKSWEVDTLRGHANNVSCVMFHTKHDIIVSNSEDKSIWVWDMTKRSAGHDSGGSAVFVARNRFAVLDKTTNQVLVKNLKNEIVKKSGLPIAIDSIFHAGTDNLLCRAEDRVVIFNLQQRLVLVIASKKLDHRCTLHETIRVKGGAWDDNGVFIYTTLNHIKYCLPNGDNGIIKTLDVPVYITKVLGNRIFCLDRDGKSRVIVIDATEYIFKLSLLKKKYDHVMSMIRNSQLCGQAMIAYLQEKGFPEVALHFVKDERTRFDLALNSGNIQIAVAAAKEIDEKDHWYKLGVEALRQERVTILENAGHLQLAYVTASTYGLHDIADRITEKLGGNILILPKGGLENKGVIDEDEVGNKVDWGEEMDLDNVNGFENQDSQEIQEEYEVESSLRVLGRRVSFGLKEKNEFISDEDYYESDRKEPEVTCMHLDHVNMLGLSKTTFRLCFLIKIELMGHYNVSATFDVSDLSPYSGESEDEENSRTSFSQAGEDDAGALDRNVNLVEYLEF